MKRTSVVALLLLSLVAAVGCGSKPAPSGGSGPAAAAAPIKIGVPMPLTGNLSQAGNVILNGIRYAADEANKKGGVLGRPIQLVEVDTNSQANAAAAVAIKLVTQDKVFALVGGYGSTPDFAMLQALKSYQPLLVHPGSSGVKLEDTFGQEKWYFHTYIWDYHRQKAAAEYLKSLNPRPRTVALAYEDSLYGTDAGRFAKQYLTEAGFQVVMDERFKSGSADLSPVLNRVKQANPDVFFWIAYAGDNIQMARQARQLGIRPAITMFGGASEKAADFGDSAEGLVYIDTWSPLEKVAGLPEWVKGFQAFKPDAPVQPGTAQGYAALRTLLAGIEKAGELDKAKVIAAMESNKVWTPFGEIGYTKSNHAVHQLVTDQQMVVVQFQKGGPQVVWPADRSTAITIPIGK
jgi:branched-chain amino acid transport system substrate-binding protein